MNFREFKPALASKHVKAAGTLTCQLGMYAIQEDKEMLVEVDRCNSQLSRMGR